MSEQTTIPQHQREVLKAIVSAGNEGVTAAGLGALLYKNMSSGRSRSAAAAQNAWQLIRKGLAERKLVRRELYRYFATAAGRKIVQDDDGEAA